ncbi:hypothetical protein ACCI51_09950 [Microbulbifer echini]|uniref:Nicotinamide phosphoribosyltransferase n=1 Tax=Microbulbifer echini TaxID=1529067 RepID=A0ABV4NN77_9GAMM
MIALGRLEQKYSKAVCSLTTVATLSREGKKLIQQYLQETADSLEGLPFKLHDFGAHAASTEETAAIGGLAHLVNFQGTDIIATIVAGRRYYYAPILPHPYGRVFNSRSRAKYDDELEPGA